MSMDIPGEDAYYHPRWLSMTPGHLQMRERPELVTEWGTSHQ